VADILYVEGVQKMVQTVLAEFGTIDVLVNIVGTAVRKSFMDMTEEEWDMDQRGNLKYVWLNSRAVAKVMIDQKKKGSIVHISTVGSVTAAPPYPAYAAAKAGLNELTKTMAVELGPYNIRVNSVIMGATLTPLIIEREKGIPTEKLAARNQAVLALGRVADPDEIGGVVLFLASDLSSFVTGHDLVADGGSLIMQSNFMEIMNKQIRINQQ
jgi:3-oxoacyl-[acyl-carrier protein] reductase